MSGGVDSSVSAALLLQDGWEVIGVTLDFVCDGSGCCDAADAHAVCGALGIRHLHRDCSPAFEERVIRPFCDAYAAGLTPSPCPGCNATTKIPELLEAAREVGATHVATGHCARIDKTPEGRFAVRAAADGRKDQSYMLSRLTQEQLACLVLPLGAMEKAQVRALAASLGLPVAQRPDSEDLCFAPQGYRALLAERGVEGVPGPIRDSAGKVLGTHTGLLEYTIGQRGGLGIGGLPAPLYVMEKDAADNAIVVGFAGEAKMRGCGVRDAVWQAVPAPDQPLDASVKLRYRSAPAPCIIRPGTQSGTFRVELAEPRALTAPGQYAVFYRGDTVLGSAMISRIVRVDQEMGE
ncbi:MAG: tRNA 2-thiouridine(34) synthase MnmA [Eggerthellaceae bacterium]|nr:tRNA 2-thiouridine(34) synthase MnmA [Eggerthellaceae bacterium]